MKRFILLLIIFIFLSGMMPLKGRATGEEVVINDKITVLSQMELLAGILTQVPENWASAPLKADMNSDYYLELTRFFKPYKNHAAMKLASKLIKENRFTYDAIPHFAVNLTELPNLAVQNSYSEYLTKRIGNIKLLESFRVAMKDLATKSQFKKKFFDPHENMYSEYIGIVKYRLEFSPEKTMDDFMGYKTHKNIIVLGCGFNVGGAFGASIKDQKGEITNYSILTPNADTAGYLSFTNMSESLIMHEYGHAYINPLTDKFQSEIKKLNLNRFYEAEADILKKNGYVGLPSFINETILRGIEGYVAKKKGQYFYDKFLQSQTKMGFKLIQFTIEQYEYYEVNRSIYKTFDKFYPVLLKRISDIK